MASWIPRSWLARERAARKLAAIDAALGTLDANTESDAYYALLEARAKAATALAATRSLGARVEDARRAHLRAKGNRVLAEMRAADLAEEAAQAQRDAEEASSEVTKATAREREGAQAVEQLEQEVMA